MEEFHYHQNNNLHHDPDQELKFLLRFCCNSLNSQMGLSDTLLGLDEGEK